MAEAAASLDPESPAFAELMRWAGGTLQQRGRSYAELARWLQPDADDPASPLVTVLAMTDDFDAAVLTAKNDREVVPAKLRAKQSGEWDEIATRAETAMGLIERDMLLLTAPEADELDYAYQRLKPCTPRPLAGTPLT